MRYGMAIDLNACIGCHACSVACKISNNLPNDMWWNRILTIGGEAMDTAAGKYPNVQMQFLPLNCQHCENPSCVKACPTGATYKREEDGIVMVDADKCIGCRMCMVACPYNARSFNFNKPKYYVEFAIGDKDAPEHQFNTVEKCNFCSGKLAREEAPACMILCPGRARYWGNLDDPNSDVSKVIRSRGHVKLLDEKGTNPSIFYLK